MTFWYLATPYSKFHTGTDNAFAFAARAAAHLVRTGIPVFSPIAHTHPIAVLGGVDPLDHKLWLAADEPFMHAACGLIVIEHADTAASAGVQHEIEMFERLKKPIERLSMDHLASAAIMRRFRERVGTGRMPA